MDKEYKTAYKNTGYFFFVLLALVLGGFYKSYIGLFPHFPKNINYVIHFHAFVLTLWVLLLIIQPILIKNGKFKTHIHLGKLSYILAPLIVFSLISLMFKHYSEAQMEEWPIYDKIEEFYFQVVNLLLFSVFYIIALLNKRNVGLHASYMIATGLVFVNPSLIRFLLYWIDSYPLAQTIVMSVIDLMIIGILLFAKSKQLNYKPYIIILLMFFVYQLPKLVKIWSGYDHVISEMLKVHK